jgi:hypothetical protein
MALVTFFRGKSLMARKTIKDLRRENDAAERIAAESPAKDGKKKTAKVPAKRKSRAKSAKEVRLKAFWGVYNQSLKRVASFEYSERKQADKKAAELNAAQKTPHFVQVYKEPIQD